MSHLGGCEEPAYLAIRPPSQTNWAVFDIDEGSRYHPASPEGEGIEPVLDALRKIGLKAGIEFQSSTTGGIHIWFPLSRAVRTWNLAIAIQQTLESNRIETKNGVLQARPNCKSYDTQYLAIRAPLTGEGNGIFIEYFGFSYEISALKNKWDSAKRVNRVILQEETLCNKPSSSNRRGHRSKTGELARAQERVRQGFTGRGQTNEIKLACLQVARLVEGLDEHEEIHQRVLELLTEAPGYEEFCGHKLEIESGRYLSKGEVNKALSLAPGGYINTWKEKENKKRHEKAKTRAGQALQAINSRHKSFTSLTNAFKYSEAIEAPSRSWWYKQENKDLLRILKETVAENTSPESKQKRGLD